VRRREEKMESSSETLEGLLADVLRMPADALQDDLAMKDVDAWDSLTHMQLIVSLENTFALELSFDDIVEMTSVGSIKRVLAEKGVVI
jgi:acyl carrier protein